MIGRAGAVTENMILTVNSVVNLSLTTCRVDWQVKYALRNAIITSSITTSSSHQLQNQLSGRKTKLLLKNIESQATKTIVYMPINIQGISRSKSDYTYSDL